MGLAPWLPGHGLPAASLRPGWGRLSSTHGPGALCHCLSGDTKVRAAVSHSPVHLLPPRASPSAHEDSAVGQIQEAVPGHQPIPGAPDPHPQSCLCTLPLARKLTGAPPPLGSLDEAPQSRWLHPSYQPGQPTSCVANRGWGALGDPHSDPSPPLPPAAGAVGSRDPGYSHGPLPVLTSADLPARDRGSNV